MENSKKPANFDWVKERSTCSIQQMFEELKLAVKQDAEAIGRLLETEIPPRKFRVLQQPKFIKVFEEDKCTDHPPAITFTLSNSVIQVVDGVTNKGLFDITIGLNDDGDCKFMVGG